MFVKIETIGGKDGYYTIIPQGPIDNDSYIEFRDKINPLFSESTRGVLVDLKNVDYISSAGLGVLFSLKKYLGTVGGELGFCNLKPQIKKLFDIVRTLSKDAMFASSEEADSYFIAIMNKELSRDKDKTKPS